ncbi:hypothetical protein DVH24_035129 [Malus domestica]|uniref:Uncharacterized protein n=1 Tax=Malus domestica TaxID=3750 RepID=A0A498IDH5_MALDO|nr:hypothetical protein DVH24_035129 [Malus domestica]
MEWPKPTCLDPLAVPHGVFPAFCPPFCLLSIMRFHPTPIDHGLLTEFNCVGAFWTKTNLVAAAEALYPLCYPSMPLHYLQSKHLRLSELDWLLGTVELIEKMNLKNKQVGVVSVGLNSIYLTERPNHYHESIRVILEEDMNLMFTESILGEQGTPIYKETTAANSHLLWNPMFAESILGDQGTPIYKETMAANSHLSWLSPPRIPTFFSRQWSWKSWICFYSKRRHDDNNIGNAGTSSFTTGSGSGRCIGACDSKLGSSINMIVMPLVLGVPVLIASFFPSTFYTNPGRNQVILENGR